MIFDGCVDVSTGTVDITIGGGRYYDAIRVTDVVWNHLMGMDGVFSIKRMCNVCNDERTAIRIHLAFYRGMSQSRQQTFVLDFRDPDNLKDACRVLEDWQGWLKTASDESELMELIHYLKIYVG